MSNGAADVNSGDAGVNWLGRNSLGEVVDISDSTLTTTTTLSPEQLKSGAADDRIIVPAVSGKVIIPVACYGSAQFNMTPYTVSDIVVGFPTIAPQVFDFGATFLSDSSNSQGIGSAASNFAGIVFGGIDPTTLPLVVSDGGNALSAGDSPVTFTTWYFLVDA